MPGLCGVKPASASTAAQAPAPAPALAPHTEAAPAPAPPVPDAELIELLQHQLRLKDDALELVGGARSGVLWLLLC